MECNKRNGNIRYAVFRDSNLNRISNVFAKSNEIVFYMNGELFRKLQRFFGPIFTFLADLSKRNVALS